jgi:ABC-type transport system involved in multi-copper enzyme maturation permease subunit
MTFGSVLDFVWQIVTSILIYLSVLVGVFVSAGLITSMMEKGTIDLMLSKPVERWQYIVGRFAGGTLMMFFEVAYLVIGLWLVAGLSLGLWSGAFLWNIFMITLAFASAFSIVVLFAVITRSSWFAVIILYAILIFAGALLPLTQVITRALTGEDSQTLATIIKVVHYTVPHIGGVVEQTTNLLLGKPMDVMPLVVSLGLTAIYVGLASFTFSRKEF